MTHRITGKSELVTMKLKIFHMTGKAILVSLDEESNAVWLPESQIEWSLQNQRTGEVEVTLPEWLAKDKELIQSH